MTPQTDNHSIISFPTVTSSALTHQVLPSPQTITLSSTVSPSPIITSPLTSHPSSPAHTQTTTSSIAQVIAQPPSIKTSLMTNDADKMSCDTEVKERSLVGDDLHTAKGADATTASGGDEVKEASMTYVQGAYTNF